MDAQTANETQIIDVIRARYPNLQVIVPLTDADTGAGIQILGRIEPCEKCGSFIAPMQRDDHRDWYELDQAINDPQGWRVRWLAHTPGRCRR